MKWVATWVALILLKTAVLVWTSTVLVEAAIADEPVPAIPMCACTPRQHRLERRVKELEETNMMLRGELLVVEWVCGVDSRKVLGMGLRSQK